ncbi:MAG: HEAT repeat domain-containing protein [Elusimicrobiota bacterium]
MSSRAIADVIQRFKSFEEIGRYELFLDLYYSRREEDRELIKRVLAGDDAIVKMMFLQYLEEIPAQRAVSLFLPLLEDDNEIIRDAAMQAYKRSVFAQKNKLLRPYVASQRPGAACFAIGALARQGDRDVLPALLGRLPNAPPEVQREILEGLRYLPDPRCVPALIPFADSREEDGRYRAIRALAEMKSRGHPVRAAIFLDRVQDDSARVRRAALLGLQAFPSQKVARVFLEKALSEDEPMPSRRRAIQGLASFPDQEWVEPLVTLMSRDPSGPLRLTIEIALKRFPADVLKRGLFAVLDGGDAAVRQQAALIVAEFLGEDPEVRRRIMEFWEKAEDMQARLGAMEVLGELGGTELIPLLLSVLKENQVLAYTAIGVLNRLWTAESGPQILKLLKEPELPQFAKQALLSAILRRGLDDTMRQDLLPWLLEGLGDEVTNIRYLSLQILEWYPVEAWVQPVLRMLCGETDDEVCRTAYRIVTKKVGGNPVPIIAAVREYPDQKAVRNHLVQMLGWRKWDPKRVFDMLYGLMLEPINLPVKDRQAFLVLCVRLLEYGSMTLERIWPFAPSDSLKRLLLEKIRDGMKDPKRVFPPLPLDFLAGHFRDVDPVSRSLFYEIVGMSRQAEGIGLLTACLLRESEPAALSAGQEGLRRLVREAPPPSEAERAKVAMPGGGVPS